MHEQPVLIVLLYSSLAALSSLLGSIPFALGQGVGRRGIGIAYATASGLMLGATYLLTKEGLDSSTSRAVAGLVVGVMYTWGAQTFAGIEELQHSDVEELPDRPEYGYKIILQDTLHSASEGLAIGVAMALSLSLGVFMAVAFAIHNIAEAMALTSLLTKRGVPLPQSAALCVATDSTQVLVAVAAYSLSLAMIQWLPLALGMAAGALLFLVMTELLPSSYRRCRRSNVAFLVSACTGMVVLLEGFLV